MGTPAPRRFNSAWETVVNSVGCVRLKLRIASAGIMTSPWRDAEETPRPATPPIPAPTAAPTPPPAIAPIIAPTALRPTVLPTVDPVLSAPCCDHGIETSG